jgi:hypothetical protein
MERDSSVNALSAALDQDQENDDKQNSCNDPNHGCVIHS